MTIRIGGLEYNAHWDIDFEFRADGNPVTPVALTAREQTSGQELQFFEDELRQMRECPFPTGPGVLVSSYNFAAEAQCFIALGWKLPVSIWDLYTSFPRITNGKVLRGAKPNSLIGALTYFNETTMEQTVKDGMRALIMRGDYSVEERREILEYNRADVLADQKLHRHLLKHLNDPLTWSRVLFDGESACAFALVQNTGVPLDTDWLTVLRDMWEDVKLDLIAEVDSQYGCYKDTTFSIMQFEGLLHRLRINWPHLRKSGRPALDAETFRDMTLAHPVLRELHQLRTAMANMRLEKLAVGADGYNRVSYNAFGALSGRCIPSTTENIFGPSTWLRHLIKPRDGRSLICGDYSQEEFAIAAIMSRDFVMQRAYRSGDPYEAFARIVGAIRPGMHPAQVRAVRDLFKTVVLAMGYGGGPYLLATRLNKTPLEASEFVNYYKRAFPVRDRWYHQVIAQGRSQKLVWDKLGWPLHISRGTNDRTIGNFPVQATGFQLLRLALKRLQAYGIMVNATIHDAFVCECDQRDADEVKHLVAEVMESVSEDLLDGFRLRTDTKVINFPDRYSDKKGAGFWEKVQGIVNRRRGVTMAVMA